jgi:hypothetical protein
MDSLLDRQFDGMERKAKAKRGSAHLIELVALKGQFFGPALFRFHRGALAQNELPTPVAPNEDVRKSERHFTIHAARVFPFQVPHSGHDTRVTISGYLHVYVLYIFRFDGVWVASPECVACYIDMLEVVVATHFVCRNYLVKHAIGPNFDRVCLPCFFRYRSERSAKAFPHRPKHRERRLAETAGGRTQQQSVSHSR